MNKTDLTRRLVNLAAAAVGLKRRTVERELRRAVCRVVHAKQWDETERSVEDALTPLFVEQIRGMARRLRAVEKRSDACSTKDMADAAAVLVDLIFDPAEWYAKLVDAVLPAMAARMAEAAVAQMLTVGVDIRRRKDTTATGWLDRHPEDVEKLEEMMRDAGVPIRVMTELPESMKRAIAGQLTDTFAQPYWREIHLTTRGDTERYLRQGLEEGWSIRRMADAMAGSFRGDTGKYAKMRATRIARTESSHALNGARKAAMDGLAEELGPQVPMRASWLSVLSATTRDTHAILDGVPADEEGLWDVGGYRVPWPGHSSLPASQRCNCFPVGTLVSGDFVGAQRGWYEGIFSEIVTKFGGRFTLTVKHPVVTSEGLVAAGMIQPSDKVLTYRSQIDGAFGLAPAGSERLAVSRTFDEPPVAVSDRLVGVVEKQNPSLSGSDKIQNKPIPIEQIFEAFLAAGSQTVTGKIEVRRAQVNDFYGDGESLQGDIEIVRADWKLLKDGKFGQFEKRGDSVLIFESEQLPLESGSGPSRLPTSGVYVSPSGFPRGSQRLLDVLGCFEITPAGSLTVGVAADFDARLDQSAAQDGPVVSGFLREALKRYSRFVAFDDVVEVRNFYSAGHVYDLQSSYGLIVAYDSLYTDGPGIVTSNCMCSIVQEFGMDEAEARQLISEYDERVETVRVGVRPGRFTESGGHLSMKKEDVDKESYDRLAANTDAKTFSKEEQERAIARAVEVEMAEARGEFVKPLSSREVEVLDVHEKIVNYVDKGYKKINRILRKGGVLDVEQQATVDLLKSLEQDLGGFVVYRGQPRLGKLLDKLRVGQVFDIQGMTSSTADPFVAEAFTLVGVRKRPPIPTIFQIKTKRGTALPSAYESHETEIILPHNASYKVKGLVRATTDTEFIESGLVNLIQLEQL